MQVKKNMVITIKSCLTEIVNKKHLGIKCHLELNVMHLLSILTHMSTCCIKWTLPVFF